MATATKRKIEMSTNHIKIDGESQNVIGDNNTVSNTMGEEGKPSLNKLMEALRKGVQEASPEAYEQVNKDVLEPLEEIARGEAPKTEREEKSLRKKIGGYIQKLEPFLPSIRKTAAAFAEGALSTIPPPASWVMGGCMEVIRDARRD